MKFRLILAAVACAAASAACSSLKDGEYNLALVTTSDGHGNWFSKPLTDGGRLRGTMMAQSRFVSDLRNELGEENVILIDAGDNLMGGNAAFYYGGVDTLSPHLYPRLASYMGYDAVVAGHCDFEAGHGVYDRVAKELRSGGIPFLAGNAISLKTGKPYFPAYAIVKKNGIKVAILGYTNADNASLMDKSAYSGIEFRSLLPLVQEDVDKVRSKEHPHVVIVAAHTASGKGDGSNAEKQGLDLYQGLKDVDFVVVGHDHSTKAVVSDSIAMIDSGKGGQSIGKGGIRLVVKGGKIVGRTLSAETVNIDSKKADTVMAGAFEKEFETVREFTAAKVGTVGKDMASREFYWGQCDYLNFLHTLALTYRPIDISLTATLLIDGKIEAGDVSFDDIKKLYPYENKLVVLSLSGKEVKDYLEASYDAWINTVSGPDEAILKLKQTKDYSTGGMAWKLAKSPANFDSAAGICYTVDVTKPYGERVNIISMADGSAYDMAKMYSVGITTYRYVGSGGLLKAAGLEEFQDVKDRVLFRGPEFRTILYEYLKKNGSIDPAAISDPKVVGTWKFIPNFAPERLRKDVETVYGKQ